MFSIKFSFIIIIINSYKKLYYKNYNKILAQESLVSFLSWLIRNRKLCGSGFGSTYSRFRIRIHKTHLYRYVYFRPLPDIPRVPNLRLAGEAFANLLMVFEFLHNFGETLGFGKHFGIFIVICRSLSFYMDEDLYLNFSWSGLKIWKAKIISLNCLNFKYFCHTRRNNYNRIKIIKIILIIISDMESLPTLNSLQSAILNEDTECEVTVDSSA